MNRSQQHERDHEHLDAWDMPPRDGPAVLVIDAIALATDGIRWGQWIDPTRDREAVRQDFVNAVGADLVAMDEWAVIDQIGLGGEMIPEELSLDALIWMARQRAEVTR